MAEPSRFLKNPETGVIFPAHDILEKMRKDLIPCDRNGTPTGEARNVEMPYLFNPFTDRIVPNQGENAAIQGLIPCMDRDHAEQIKKRLMGLSGDTSQDVEQPQQASEQGESKGLDPNATNEAPQPQVTLQRDETLEELRNADVYSMDMKALKAFAEKHFEEKVDARKSLDAVREQVQVMINGKIAESI